MVRPLRSALLAVLLSPFAASPAFLAQSPALADEPDPPGRAEFEKASRYFQAQEYEAALPWFERAVELSGRRPSAVRGLAQCERALKMYDRAIAHFREYLESKPTPPDAPAIEETIRLIEELRADAVRGPPPVRTPTAAAPPPPSLSPVTTETAGEGGLLESPLFWIVSGVVVVGGAIALALALGSSDPAIYGGNTGVVLERLRPR